MSRFDLPRALKLRERAREVRSANAVDLPGRETRAIEQDLEGQHVAATARSGSVHARAGERRTIRRLKGGKREH